MIKKPDSELSHIVHPLTIKEKHFNCSLSLLTMKT